MYEPEPEEDEEEELEPLLHFPQLSGQISPVVAGIPNGARSRLQSPSSFCRMDEHRIPHVESNRPARSSVHAGSGGGAAGAGTMSRTRDKEPEPEPEPEPELDMDPELEAESDQLDDSESDQLDESESDQLNDRRSHDAPGGRTIRGD